MIGTPKTPVSFQLNSATNYVRYDVTTLVENHRTSGSTFPIETVILGCTNFPLIEDEFRHEFDSLRNFETEGTFPYRDLIADEIRFVNPAELTAKELFRSLALSRFLLDHPAATS